MGFWNSWSQKIEKTKYIEQKIILNFGKPFERLIPQIEPHYTEDVNNFLKHSYMPDELASISKSYPYSKPLTIQVYL